MARRTGPVSGLKVRHASVRRAEAFRWVWEWRILLGYLNLIVGEEGVGKGTLAAWVGARITRGELAGDLAGRPRQVLFIGDEDSWDHIWTPRLHAAGANLKRCRYVEQGTAGGMFDVTNTNDITELAAYVADHGVAFVYFDQLLDNLGIDTDSWKDKQVRQALAPVRSLARETGCAVAMCMHPNKKGGSFRNRVSGTPAFNALARSSLLVARHPADPGQVVAVRAKGNYSQEPPAFEFRIEQRTIRGRGGKPVPTSRVTGERECELRAADVLDGSGSRGQTATQTGECRKAIREALADGEPHPCEEIITALGAQGYSKRTVQRAGHDLGVKPRKIGFEGGWSWQLP